MSKDLHADSAAAHLLWTGGWDSTFRLLYMLLKNRRRVATYYLIDTGRPAWSSEVLTIHRVKAHLRDHHPDAFRLMEPTRIFSRHDFSPNATISQAFDSLREKTFLGPQYRWLAQFAAEMRVPALEMSAHCDGRVNRMLAGMLAKPAEAPDGEPASWRWLPGFEDRPEYALFGGFEFPIYDVTKLRMAEIAEQYGFSRILEMTSFCHMPLAGGRPCGTCNPCIYTMEEGLGRRLGRLGRLRYFTKKAGGRIPASTTLFYAMSTLQRKVLGT